ncbi:hypothetical protein [Paenibacillus aceris]|uniref:Uncharacterized protein n=1 Tax=Paenibacillus aceris TaxID=869555 RepID=A0ABS4HXB3_9BACL|nr:hypothetical protein [Paenibacillus aceris]MBP1963268.1 hypothetical protein [Paenibacillus aceris]NHW36223.1 hypothetical protein [Paenibacillus aceris]
MYFAMVGIPKVLSHSEDFQYHDSYFLVIHIDPYNDEAAGTIGSFAALTGSYLQ